MQKYGRHLFLLLFFCAVLSCNNIGNENIESQIGQKIQKDCVNTKPCLINIAQLTDFKWDKLLVTNFSISQEALEREIGTGYPDYQEFSAVMVFLNKGKIVHSENNEREIETATDKAVIFDYPDSNKCMTYTPAQAIFKAKTDTFNKGVYYKLYQ